MILGSFRNSGTELFKELTGVAVVSSGGASFKSMWMQCALELDYVRQFILVRCTASVGASRPWVHPCCTLATPVHGDPCRRGGGARGSVVDPQAGVWPWRASSKPRRRGSGKPIIGQPHAGTCCPSAAPSLWLLRG